MPDKATIWVRSILPVAADGGTPVAFYEQDPAHPGGEAWVTGPDPVEVGNIASVLAAIGDKRIEEVPAAKRASSDKS
jgi:hypothetical protein